MVVNGKTAGNGNNGAQSAVRFDSLNKEEAIHPNIVRIDVHGAWRKVFDGMRESLRNDVEHLYMELDTPADGLSRQPEDVRHVIRTLRKIGMDVFEIQGFRGYNGSRIVPADEEQIAGRGALSTMLYATKRR